MAERFIKVEGLVIKTRTLGEADRLVTLLTRDEGKFEAVARGARKTKSKLAAGVDLFAHGRFSLHHGRTWPIVTGCDSLSCFNHFRDDPELYPYGLYLAELANRFVSGEEPCPEIFALLLEGWQLLGSDLDRNLLCRAFELKLAAGGGYNPQLQFCTVCGADHTNLFSPRQGGLVCPVCKEVDALTLEAGTLALARRLITVPLSLVVNLRATAGQKKELAGLVNSFFACHLDLGELKTRRLLPE